jgi:hypothetical protein
MALRARRSYAVSAESPIDMAARNSDTVPSDPQNRNFNINSVCFSWGGLSTDTLVILFQIQQNLWVANYDTKVTGMGIGSRIEYFLGNRESTMATIIL